VDTFREREKGPPSLSASRQRLLREAFMSTVPATPPSRHRSQRCLMSLRLSSRLPASGEKQTSSFNLHNALLSRPAFEGSGVACAVLFVNVRIREHRLWRIGTRSQVAQYLVIISHQRIDQRDQSARDMTNGSSSPFVRLRSFIVGTSARN
jgi:hypothetical protein